MNQSLTRYKTFLKWQIFFLFLVEDLDLKPDIF